ncbi:hypothetical protein QBC38DRAFT_490514 [Podospora fimiseda]|uniref:Uncharacterized protein n=1 Tax=Podospora fimiseda TaxID=252190 RepID=A0AAN6YQQ9_9PEZI|nr:hypothetical protein QBC38DRAFT_490514 [Podospora fimiseda]
MSSSPQGGQPSGPPYPSPYAITGGIPTNSVDTPISAVLLVFFIASAATHMTIFQKNRRRDHKFLFSALLFGFSMARIVALTMRIVWANRQTNTNIALAAGIFVAAGVLLLFVVNLIFAQRIVRSYHPNFGWNKTVSIIWNFVIFSVLGILIMVIICNVHSMFTLDIPTRMRERDVLRFAGVYLAVLAFLPIPIVLTALLWPTGKEGKRQIEKFGQGRMRTKVRLLLGTAILLSLGAWFRAGTNFLPRLRDDPAWYHHRAAFYCFNFVIELIVVYSYAIARFDKRFHIPNGSDGPGSYSGSRVNKEEEVFGSSEDGRDKQGDEEEEGSRPISGTLVGSESPTVEKDTIVDKAVSPA